MCDTCSNLEKLVKCDNSSQSLGYFATVFFAQRCCSNRRILDGTHFSRPCWQRHRSYWVCLVEDLFSSSLRGPSPQALTLFRGVRLIAWRPRRPSLGEGRWSPRYFWKCRARVGFSLAPGPTLKRPCAVLARSVGCATNTATVFSFIQ